MGTAGVSKRAIQNWKFWVGMGFSGTFLYLAFRRTDLLAVGYTLRQAAYIWLFPAVVLTLLSFYLRAYRWHYLLESIKPITISSLFSATLIGFMANNLLPARLGEFVRAYVIGRREGIRGSASFATKNPMCTKLSTEIKSP